MVANISDIGGSPDNAEHRVRNSKSRFDHLSGVQNQGTIDFDENSMHPSIYEAAGTAAVTPSPSGQ
jgi:hypothetical protein